MEFHKKEKGDGMNRLLKSFIYSVGFHIVLITVGYGIFKVIELKSFGGNLNLGLAYVGPLENNLYLLALMLILLSTLLFTGLFLGIISLLGLYKKRIAIR